MSSTHTQLQDYEVRRGGGYETKECAHPWCSEMIRLTQWPQHVGGCEPPEDWDGGEGSDV